MPATSGSVKAARGSHVLALTTLTAVVWVLRGYIWPSLSNVEVDALRAMLDPSLFQRDFSVQECLHFSPRYYYNALILLPARAGLPLEWSFVCWHLVALGTLLGGLRALAREAALGEFSAGILILWVLNVGVGTLGGVYFYTYAPVPAVWAGAAVAWGAVWAWRERWWASFACLGGAAMLQFLVGFYGGVLAVMALLVTRQWRRLPCIGPWLLGLALVYVPMALTRSAGASGLDNGSFVFIYAQLRIPHHLVPSTWGWPYWVQAVIFYAGAAWFIHRTGAGRPRREQTLLFWAMGLIAVALALNYLLVEVHPLALAAKLQPGRLTPLTQGLVLLLLATRVQTRIAGRDWLGAASLALIPFSAFPGVLLLLAAILSPATSTEASASWRKIVLAAAVVLAFQPFDPSIAVRLVRLELWAAILATQLLAFGLVRRPALVAAFAIVTIAGVGAYAYASLTTPPTGYLSAHFAINAPPAPADAPGLLGRRFAARSSKDALVLVPPTGDVWTFKLYSHRAVVVDDKGTPFTDAGLREWHDRMEQVMGTAFLPGVDPAAAWQGRSPGALLATAHRYGANYILTRDDWHASLTGRAIDREAGWTLWAIADAPAVTPPK